MDVVLKTGVVAMNTLYIPEGPISTLLFFR